MRGRAGSVKDREESRIYQSGSREEEKAQAFELQNWLRSAQQRTEEFLRNGPRAPTTWVLANPHAPYERDLLQGGEGQGGRYFIARAPHKVSS